jgi:hypothetical protein
MGDLFGDLAVNTRTSNLFKFNSDNSYIVYKTLQYAEQRRKISFALLRDVAARRCAGFRKRLFETKAGILYI